MAAAIGAGLPITELHGNMIVDIGGGRPPGGHLDVRHRLLKSVRVAGNDGRGNHAVHQTQIHLLIGERRLTDQDRNRLGSPDDEPMSIEIKGRNLIEGIPKTIVVSDEEIREALADS
jgi:rod shape-determining protein MreB